MGRFRKWVESTARSRAKSAAARCIGPKLPGAQAHSHRTDPIAAQSVGDSGEIGDNCVGGKPKGRKNKQIDWDMPESCGSCKFMKSGQTPDYSFDAFVKKAEAEKGNIASSIQSAREKEIELDKEAEDAKKDSDPTHSEEDDKDTENTWKELRKISKDKDKEEKDQKQDKSPKSQKHSGKKASASQDV